MYSGIVLWLSRGWPPNPSGKLASNIYRGEAVEFDELGMAKDKGRAEAESNDRNQGDGVEAAIGNGCLVAFRIGDHGAMIASMQEPMFKIPMLGKVHPPVVFLFPSIMPQAANCRR